MTVEEALFCTDGEGEGAVHFQEFDGGPASWGEASDAVEFPTEMVGPGLLTGME